jgi:DNA polymerase-3 subunit gamma/tau
MNLAQKLIPPTLNEVIGHEKTIKEWKQRSKEKNFPQVSLFIGPTGVGKTTLQRIVAKNILCEHTDNNGNACNNCSICNAINLERPAINYYEYDGYDLNIEKARDIEEIASRKISFETSNKKVFVLDELQALSKNPQALKKLLKFLERQYKEVYFLLGSMETLKLPPAILGRTIKYNLKPLTSKQIGEYLYKYCESINIKIDTEEKASILLTISEAARGSMRDALAYLERVIYGNIWNEKDLLSELDLVTEKTLSKIINGLLSGNINVLTEVELTDETIEQLRKKLNFLYKQAAGLQLPFYIKGELDKIDTSVHISIIEMCIDRLNSLLKFTYLTPTLIEFTLIGIITQAKQMQPGQSGASQRPSRI